MIEKRCPKCSLVKAIDEFYRCNKTNYGVKCWCKDCCKTAGAIWRKTNTKKRKANNIVYRNKNKDKIKAYRNANKDKEKQYQREYYIANCDKLKKRMREYRVKNKDKISLNGKAYRASNKDKIRENATRYVRERCKIDQKFRLNKRFMVSIYRCVCGSKNGRRWESPVDYTIEDLKRHLEKRFQPGMTWENYGKWHIDHIIPISAFNFSMPEHEDFKRCWALKNLRPLWATDNIKKSNKLTKHFQPMLAI